MNTPLQQAAQELIDRWDSPMWRYQQATTDVIAELRKALDAELQQSVKPVAFMTGDGRVSMAETVNTAMPKAAKDSFCIPLYLHPPQHFPDAGKMVEPVTANDDDVICPSCCHQFRAIPVGVQQLMLGAGFEPPFKHPPQQAKPAGERADLIEQLNRYATGDEFQRAIEQAVNMLEADAQQAKQVPMTTDDLYAAYIAATDQMLRAQDERLVFAFARAIEAHHGITPK